MKFYKKIIGSFLLIAAMVGGVAVMPQAMVSAAPKDEVTRGINQVGGAGQGNISKSKACRIANPKEISVKNNVPSYRMHIFPAVKFFQSSIVCKRNYLKSLEVGNASKRNISKIYRYCIICRQPQIFCSIFIIHTPWHIYLITKPICVLANILILISRSKFQPLIPKNSGNIPIHISGINRTKFISAVWIEARPCTSSNSPSWINLRRCRRQHAVTSNGPY